MAQCLGGPGVEVSRPGGHDLAGHHPPRKERQAVGHEAGPDDQHALLAQRAEVAAEVQEPARVLRRQAELQHGHVTQRVHDLQRDPSAVIEAAVRVLVHRLAARQRSRHPPGQVAGVRCGVCHLVVPGMKAAEVVHQRGTGRRRGQHDRRRLPVRADDQDAARFGHALGPGGQLAHPRPVVEQRRGAVAEVQRRKRSVVRHPGPLRTADLDGAVHEGVERPAGHRGLED